MSNQKSKDKQTSFNHILKYTGIFSIVQILNILMNIVRNKIAAIFLGPSGLGVLSLYNTASNLLNQTTNFGIPMSGVKHISEIHEIGDSHRLRDYACTVRSFSVLSGLFGVLVGFSVILFAIFILVRVYCHISMTFGTSLCCWQLCFLCL